MTGTTPLATALLQTGTSVSQSTRLALQGYELVGAAIGLFIAYQAYRGYRRNRSRPMLFIALGFVLILGPPIPLVALAAVVPTVPEVPLQFVIQTFEVAGLLSIVYALRMDA